MLMLMFIWRDHQFESVIKSVMFASLYMYNVQAKRKKKQEILSGHRFSANILEGHVSEPLVRHSQSEKNGLCVVIRHLHKQPRRGFCPKHVITPGVTFLF